MSLTTVVIFSCQLWLQAECAAVESEITALELSNQQLEAKVRRREDAEVVNNSNTSGILTNSQGQLMNPLCTNQILLADNISTAHKHLLSRLVQLTDQVSLIFIKMLYFLYNSSLKIIVY